MLKKDLIKDTINYIKAANTDTEFYYGMTTNGTLIDDDFINFVKENNFLHIAYSIDGDKETQNINRIATNGDGSFNIVEKMQKKYYHK